MYKTETYSCLPHSVHPQRMDVRGRAPQGVSPKLGRMDRLHRYGRHIIYRDLSSHVLFPIYLYAFTLSSQKIIFLRLLYV